MKNHILQATIVILLLFGIIGCASNTQLTQSVPTTEAVITDATLFDFSVPDGYMLESESENSVSILKDGQAIGGILLTDIDPDCIHDTECEHIGQYLNDLAPSPLFCEYINMYGSNMCHITYRITNRDTGEQQEQSRHIFMKDGVYFDLWLDKAFVTEDEVDAIVKEIAK